MGVESSTYVPERLDNLPKFTYEDKIDKIDKISYDALRFPE